MACSVPALAWSMRSRLTGHHAGKLALVAPPVAVPGGEQVKNELFFVEQMQRQVFEHAIDRHSYVIAVGGGALLDAAGLVAGTTHRGIRLIRVPTTVLAQDDSGVGVKNGVNLYGVKNFCGTFTAVCGAQRHRPADPAVRAGQSRRHGRGGEGGVDPRWRLLRLAGAQRRRPDHVPAPGACRHDPPLRRAAHAPDRAAAIRSRPAAPGRWTTATGRRTSWRA